MLVYYGSSCMSQSLIVGYSTLRFHSGGQAQWLPLKLASVLFNVHGGTMPWWPGWYGNGMVSS